MPKVKSVGLDCLLVADNQVITPYPVYPLGIAHLAGALEAAGHRPYQFDLLGHGGLKALARKLSASPPDLVALSIRNLDTVDSTAPDNFIPKAQETMALIRRFCRAPVVVGGPAFSIMPEAIIELFQADYGVVGEGEIISNNSLLYLETQNTVASRLLGMILNNFIVNPFRIMSLGSKDHFFEKFLAYELRFCW